MQHKADVAAGISYAASTGGVAVGSFLATHWLQVLSALFVVLTYLTQVYFAWRKDQRDTRREKAEALRLASKSADTVEVGK